MHVDVFHSIEDRVLSSFPPAKDTKIANRLTTVAAPLRKSIFNSRYNHVVNGTTRIRTENQRIMSPLL